MTNLKALIIHLIAAGLLFSLSACKDEAVDKDLKAVQEGTTTNIKATDESSIPSGVYEVPVSLTLSTSALDAVYFQYWKVRFKDVFGSIILEKLVPLASSSQAQEIILPFSEVDFESLPLEGAEVDFTVLTQSCAMVESKENCSPASTKLLKTKQIAPKCNEPFAIKRSSILIADRFKPAFYKSLDEAYRGAMIAGFRACLPLRAQCPNVHKLIDSVTYEAGALINSKNPEPKTLPVNVNTFENAKLCEGLFHSVDFICGANLIKTNITPIKWLVAADQQCKNPESIPMLPIMTHVKKVNNVTGADCRFNYSTQRPTFEANVEITSERLIGLSSEDWLGDIIGQDTVDVLPRVAISLNLHAQFKCSSSTAPAALEGGYDKIIDTDFETASLEIQSSLDNGPTAIEETKNR